MLLLQLNTVSLDLTLERLSLAVREDILLCFKQPYNASCPTQLEYPARLQDSHAHNFKWITEEESTPINIYM